MQEQEIIVEQENAIYNNNYNDLKNKPSINNIELSGNKTLAELGYIPYDDTELKQELNNKQDKGDYALKKDIPDVSSFITNSVNDLINYYLKNDTYSKAEVNTLVNNITKVTISIVDTLPTTGESNIIYFVPKTGGANDVYDEYVWITNAWEHIGSTSVDLTGYATESWVNTQIANFLTEAQVNALITNALTSYALKSEVPNKVSQLQNDTGFITGYTETDPTVPSYIKSITEEDITNWNNIGETIQELTPSVALQLDNLSNGIYRLNPTTTINMLSSGLTIGRASKNSYLIISKSSTTNYGWIYIADTATYIGKRGKCFTFDTNDITQGIMASILNETNALSKTNTTEYTPTNDYNPATKKYVDDIFADIGSGSIKTLDSTQTYNGWELEEGVYYLSDFTSIMYKSNNSKNFKGFILVVNNSSRTCKNFFVFNDSRAPSFELGMFHSIFGTYQDYFLGGILTTNNGNEYQVISNYNPAHKLYVDTQIKEKINGTFTLEGTTLNITTSTTETTTEV